MTTARDNQNRQKSLRLRPDCPETDQSHCSPKITFIPKTFISGGQSGVDRAALDFAIENGIEQRGWCPAGRLAEDGPIPDNYKLSETESSEYSVRTEQNVVDSDATLILYCTSITGGTRLTSRFATRHGKPFMSADLAADELDVELNRCRMWLADVRPATLNIAGPRESNVPGIYQQSLAFLSLLIPRQC